MSVLRMITDKKGRRFEAGKPLDGAAGVCVESIVRIGNYVTVRFSAARAPSPILFHADDLAATVEKAEG